MSLILSTVLLLVFITSECESSIMSCFSTLSGQTMRVGSVFSESVEFQEDCLRACLTVNLIDGDSVCTHVMYNIENMMCNLINQSFDQTDISSPESFLFNSHLNYFVNSCVKSKGGKEVTRNLVGSAGGYGIIRFAIPQPKRSTRVMAIIDMLSPDKTYVIEQMDYNTTCDHIFNNTHELNNLPSTEILRASTDSRGLYVNSWQPLESGFKFDALSTRTLVVWDKTEKSPVLCANRKINRSKPLSIRFHAAHSCATKLSSAFILPMLYYLLKNVV